MSASAVIYVKDIGPMRQFYERCFGLASRVLDDRFCVLESDSWSLSLVAVPDAVATRIALSSPPRRREEVPVKLAFAVRSIAEIRLIAAELGGQIDPDATIWEFDGRAHCDGVDPEGNVIQLLEARVQVTSNASIWT